MPALLPILGAVWSFASSQFGVVLIVATVAFGYGHHKASVACAEREAAAHAIALQAHAQEMARQAKAAEAIAIADRARGGDTAKAEGDMQADIDSLKKGKGNAKTGDCVIDGDYARRVQRLDRHGRR